MNIDKLMSDLLRDEGKRNKMYLDSLDIPTIGVGHNLQVGISDAAVNQILLDDIAIVLSDMDRIIPWYKQLSETRQRVLANMVFNMGITRLIQFRKFLNALQSDAWDLAAEEMLDSKWAQQVGQRAVRLAKMMRQG